MIISFELCSRWTLLTKGNNHACISGSNIFFSSEADPTALAKYVTALVKKDKPTQELKSSCVEQLDIFLQSSKFLDKILLFKDKKNYSSNV